MNEDLTKLPDHPALQQLGRALWRDGSARGAALMVGAGFSRNAMLPGLDTKAPPLWSGLVDEMVSQLGANAEDYKRVNPLRVAEEYRTYFGQAALDDFIRARFPDKAWQPGPLHTELMKLPWADVLTTNWDTLLERTSELVDAPYDVVALEADLPHSRAPRIVKLHGSIGDAGPLIFAEEDYRTYPEKHAAFLNLARQVFVENELCVLGFSGDDPNFLQWAGWVRDQLGGKARRIYLVGHFGLSAAKRRYFEAHNITPIDLASLVDAGAPDKHERVTKLFLDALNSARPKPLHEWVLTPSQAYPLNREGADAYSRTVKDAEFCAQALKETAANWKSDRLRYPGWLVCPHRFRTALGWNVDEAWLLRPEALKVLSCTERAEILYELVWRRTTSASVLTEAVTTAIMELLEECQSDIALEIRGYLVTALLRDARISYDAAVFERWTAYIEADSELSVTCRLDALYQKALFARDRGKLRDVVGLVDVLETEEAVWKLRRAALYAEAGRYFVATKLIKEATGELEKAHRLDRSSLWVQARLGWADMISRGVVAAKWSLWRELPAARDFKDLQIDPSGELDNLMEVAQSIDNKRRESAQGMVALFEPGRYRVSERLNDAMAAPASLVPLFELDQILESTGVPTRINHASYCAHTMMRALEVSFRPSLQWYTWLLRTLQGPYDKPFDRYFGRLAIAQMDPSVSGELIAQERSQVEYWLERLDETKAQEFDDEHSHAKEQLRLHFATLGRLSVRLSESDAIELFELALNWIKSPELQHPWLLESLKELAKYSLQSMSKGEQAKHVLAILSLPLSSETNAYRSSWQPLVETIWEVMPAREPGSNAWRSCVQQLISAADKGRPERPESIQRLAYLLLREALEPSENEAFGAVLWSDAKERENGLPEGTNLLASTFAVLPAPEGVDAEARVRAHLFGAAVIADSLRISEADSTDVERKQSYFMSLQHIANLRRYPTSNQAASMFDEILTWDVKASAVPSGAHLFAGLPQWIQDRAGNIITTLLLPSMTDEERTAERCTKLLEAIEKNDGWSGLAALTYFFKCHDGLASKLSRLIMKGIIAPNHQGVQSAALAVVAWAERHKDGAEEIPHEIYNRLLSAIELAPEHGLNALLECARKLLAIGGVPAEFAGRLMHALSELLSRTNYTEIDPASIRAVSISLVRAQCVKLAAALMPLVEDDEILERWMHEAREDALPEVRFAAAM